MILKNVDVAYVMIVQKKTLPFEVLLFKWYMFCFVLKDILSRKYFTCVYYPNGNFKIMF